MRRYWYLFLFYDQVRFIFLFRLLWFNVVQIGFLLNVFRLTVFDFRIFFLAEIADLSFMIEFRLILLFNRFLLFNRWHFLFINWRRSLIFNTRWLAFIFFRRLILNKLFRRLFFDRWWCFFFCIFCLRKPLITKIFYISGNLNRWWVSTFNIFLFSVFFYFLL